MQKQFFSGIQALFVACKSATLMTRILFGSFVFCTLLSAQPADSAQRIISLSPSSTEFAYAAGMGDALLAASSYSDYPPAAQQLERVADHRGINIERILLLKPDLVLAWKGGNPARPLHQLEQLGIRVLYINPLTLDDLASELDVLAKESPQPAVARESAAQIRAQLADLRRQYAREKPLNVFIQYGTQAMFTPAKGTLQSEIVALCGGKNIFSDSSISWPKISREQVLLRKPDVILLPGSADSAKQVRAYWGNMLNVPVISVDEALLSRNGPRMVQGAQQICQALAKISPIS
ncbi:MAG: vitamin B12 ABC transporter substrate-binding protein BtuF [Plesiomonas sp.]|uniref:vitamin B12 ABC transporter substrate-binding protein BtuF n=1 Tax=Plesiomonas sp. TaxID=2486279 RepID=UPI003F383982